MSDLGHEIRFGAFLTPAAQGHDEVVRLATVVDGLGFDLIGIQDHPYQPSFLDTWTLLSYIAARTSRVTLFPDVANLPLRPPAVLARAAASLDVLSGGRVELGLGSGAFWDAIVAMGGERRLPAEAVDALGEAIDVIRALWTPGRTPRIDGRHYSLHGAKPGPFPAHPIGIWLGAYKPRMLRLTARKADGWVPSLPYAPPAELTEMTRILDAAAGDAGRDPTAIQRILNINGQFTRLGSDDFLVGPPKQWAEQLTGLALGLGFSGFVLPGDDEHDLRTFAEEVAPLVRAEVAGARGGSTPAPTPVDEQREQLDLWSGDPLGEARRPRVSAPAPADPTRGGAQLKMVHNHFRQELEQIRDAVEQVADGERSAASARSLINELTVRQNFWTLGSFCAAYCRVLTTHHTIEDQLMFPMIAEREPALAPVVHQLEQEHEVIAGVLAALDESLAKLIDGGSIADVRDHVRLLDQLLVSHLDYEEEQLIEPLERHRLDV
jgi:alkanesulfonate monooxygenase SsuD/methylene tetrahydromethanopterin reductase-like flavin-dependent oxidoreductase (luciferase family)